MDQVNCFVQNTVPLSLISSTVFIWYSDEFELTRIVRFYANFLSPCQLECTLTFKPKGEGRLWILRKSYLGQYLKILRFARVVVAIYLVMNLFALHRKRRLPDPTVYHATALMEKRMQKHHTLRREIAFAILPPPISAFSGQKMNIADQHGPYKIFINIMKK